MTGKLAGVFVRVRSDHRHDEHLAAERGAARDLHVRKTLHGGQGVTGADNVEVFRLRSAVEETLQAVVKGRDAFGRSAERVA
jgi:hypothetical protein